MGCRSTSDNECLCLVRIFRRLILPNVQAGVCASGSASKSFFKRKIHYAYLDQAREEGVQVIENVELSNIIEKNGRVSGFELTNPIGLKMQDACESVVLSNEMKVVDGVDFGPATQDGLQIYEISSRTGQTGIFRGMQCGPIISLQPSLPVRGQLFPLTITCANRKPS